MKKVPLTQEGVDLKRKELEALPESEFRTQLKDIRYKFRDWAKNNFQLNKDQIAYLDETPDEFINHQGKGIAMAFDYQLELQLTTPDTYQAPLASRRRSEVVVRGNASWSPGGPFQVHSYYIGIGYNLPIN